MAKPTVSLPQGTRDFSAEVVYKRQYIFATIRTVFELYGFAPLETPAMENLDTLMGKYGEEGDKLIFKILNNGDLLQEIPIDELSTEVSIEFINYLSELGLRSTQIGEFFEEINNPMSQKVNELTNRFIKRYLKDTYLSKRALRYDLTIPFARYVAMNYGQLTMPFKRYQIQPVWRADRPQKGRYREFYQCDADVVGSNSLLNEVELVNIYATVFEKLGIDVEIRINSRKILAALAEICGGADKMVDITVAIDKLDKIGIEKVKEELQQRGLTDAQISIIEKYLSIDGSNDEKLLQLKSLLQNNATGNKGIEEIDYILNYQSATINQQLIADFTLARGLNYYTGIIFEIKAKNVQMGSIGGGGRYDDLTGLFGVPNVPGVGISFGVDRIYDVMEELKLFPTEVQVGTTVLFFNLGKAEAKKAFELMQQLRANNTSCELFHETTKFDKQFKYADKKHIPYAIMIGSKELEDGTCVVKNLSSSEQTIIAQTDLLSYQF